MKGTAGWIAANIGKPSRTADGLAAAIPFAIWQRQWEVCDLAGDRVRSREISDKVRSLSQKDSGYRTASLILECQVAIYSAKYSSALQLAEEALAISTNNNEYSRLAEIYGQLSQAHQYLSDYDKAAEYRLRAADLYRSNNEQTLLGNTWSSLGLICWKTGKYREALSHLDKAREIFEKNCDDRSMAMVLTNTANVRLATDEAEQAHKEYLKALGICQRIGDRAKQSSICNNLGSIMLRQARYQDSLQYFQQGLEIDRALGNITGQATKLNNMAVMLGSMGRHEEAMADFEQALRIDTATGNLDGQMRKLGNIATLYAIKSDYPRALEYIDRALDIARKINSSGYYGQFLSQKLGYLGETGDNQGAKVVGEEALKVIEESGNLSQLTTLYSSLADIYYDTGETDRALKYSQQAVEIIGQHQLFEVYKENSWFTHNRILERMGRQEEAEKFLKLAYEEVQARARNMSEEERSGFLTKNKTIAMIVEKWERTHKKEA